MTRRGRAPWLDAAAQLFLREAMILKRFLRKLWGKASYDPKAWGKLDREWDNNFSSMGWSPYRKNILDWVMEIEDDTDSMLDVGCHIGHYINALRERGYSSRYFGIDVTFEFIRRARKILPDEYFTFGNILNEYYWDDQFDLVMCVGVLMHLPEITAPMKNIFRTATKYVLLSTYGSKRNTYENHRDGFLNTYYSKSDILSEVPEGWELITYKEFKRVDIPKHNWMFQFLFRRV